MAKAEAAKAEAETPDEDTQPDEPQPDEAAEGEDVLSPDELEEALDDAEREREGEDAEQSIEAQRQGLEREATRHHKALAKLMPGFEDSFSECPACMTFGYVPNPPLLVDETREACPACNGHGGVISGSRVEGHEVEQCSACMGNGWRTKAAPPLTPVAPPSYGPPMPGNGAPADDPRVAALRAEGYIVTPTAPPPAPVA